MSTPKFFSWLRSQLRRVSMKWAPRAAAKKAARRPYNGPNKRRKWQYQCAICEVWFAGTDVQVDHIHPCGSLTAYEDLPEFVERLFCNEEGFRVLCKSCHQTVTNKNRGK